MPPPNIDDDSKYASLHVRAPDDSEYVMNGVYKDMAIATFKRTIAIKGKIRSWEGIELYYMGVEMQNSCTLDSYDLQDGAVIRCVLSGPQVQTTVQENAPPPAYLENSYGGIKLHNVFYLDINTNSPKQVGPVTIEMPVKVFREKVCRSQCIDAEYVRLIYGGKQLEDIKNGEVQTLKDYNFQNNAYVTLVIRVHGGIYL